MRLRRSRGDTEPFADLVVREAGGDQLDHLALTLGDLQLPLTQYVCHAADANNGLAGRTSTKRRIYAKYARRRELAAGALVERRHLARVVQRQVVVVADDHGHFLQRPAAGRRDGDDVGVDPVRLAVGAGHLAAGVALVRAPGARAGHLRGVERDVGRVRDRARDRRRVELD